MRHSEYAHGSCFLCSFHLGDGQFYLYSFRAILLALRHWFGDISSINNLEATGQFVT